MFRVKLSTALKAVQIATQKVQVKTVSVTKYAFSSKALFYTNIGISITLSGLGDAIEQRIEMHQDKEMVFDPTRNFNMSMTGLPSAIICHNWYKFLDNRIKGRTIRAVMLKVFFDQIICSPLCISAFFFTLCILERSTFKQAVDEIKQKAMKLYVAEWVVWPPAQFINFYVLPLRFRVVFDSTISLGYDIYTSYVRFKSEQSSDRKELVPSSTKDLISNSTKELIPNSTKELICNSTKELNVI